MKRQNTIVLLLTVFLANFLSLVFQVIWTRKLSVVFGSTAFSISAVLTVFLSGIALGGYLGGALMKGSSGKVRLFGLALIALGVYSALSLYLLGFIKYPFYLISGSVDSALAVNLLKLVFSFFILIFPTTVIGAVFPVATHLYSREFNRLGSTAASVYFLDTLGASLGALTSGFLLVPFLGLNASTVASGVLYVVTGVIALLFLREPEEAPAAPAEEATAAGKPFPRRSLVFAALFFGGAAAITLEVAWSRYFHLLFGTSIYAFSLVVAAFLLGLSAGSIVIKRFLDRLKNPGLVFAYMEILIASFSLLTIAGSEKVEGLYFRHFFSSSGFYSFQALLFSVAFAAMLLPTTLMGANFPLAISLLGRGPGTGAKDAGTAFAVNTAGGILGAFLAGFAVIPLLGIEMSALAAALVYLAVGFVFLAFSSRSFKHYAVAAAVAAVFLAAGLRYGGTDPGLGVYYHGVIHKTFEGFRSSRKKSKAVYSRHGYYGLVSVLTDEDGKSFSLLNNGKVDASTSIEDMATQLLLRHLPLFFHTAPDDVLNIGLGGGFTLGAVITHPNVKTVDSIEIDPLVVEATGKFFLPFNNRALEDPRARVIIQDGRHFLETTRKRYDVIISEPPNIWVAGVSQLFTREFYSTVVERLKPGGILVQWVPGYEMREEDLDLILKTVKERFSHAALWRNGPDVLILASQRPPVLNLDYASTLLRVPAIRRDMDSAMGVVGAPSAEAFLLNPARGFEYMDIYLKGVERTNTDDLPYLEFSTVRNLFEFPRLKRP